MIVLTNSNKKTLGVNGNCRSGRTTDRRFSREIVGEVSLCIWSRVLDDEQRVSVTLTESSRGITARFENDVFNPID